jgi:ubiquinone/menaquinone biosynthesis C-methylase UbiE
MRTPNHSLPAWRSLGYAYRAASARGTYGRINDMTVQSPIPAAPVSRTIDLAAIKGRQKAAWGSGDYAVVGTTLQIVGENLCEAVDLRSNQRVLDVAAGNGNATLAAARRFAEVVSTDFVGALLERARLRAHADGLTVKFEEADAEALPFADDSFDVVLSTFGVMFTPNQELAASELLRVVRPGGKIGLANWTPDGFIGRLFKAIGKYVPATPGVRSPILWGDKAHLDTLFGAKANVVAISRNFMFRYKSAQHWLEFFRTYYGPVLKAFAAIDPEQRKALETDIYALLRQFNTTHDGSLVVPGEYLEVVIDKKR